MNHDPSLQGNANQWGQQAYTVQPQKSTCLTVWAHDEHQDLQVRYSRTLEDLATARSEVIRLQHELATYKNNAAIAAQQQQVAQAQQALAIQPDLPVAGPSSFSNNNSNMNNSNVNNNNNSAASSRQLQSLRLHQEQQAAPPPAAPSAPRSARQVQTLPARPPNPLDLPKYRNELAGWSRPVYRPEQLRMINNYLSSQSVVTNLRIAMVDLHGECPSPAEWKMWTADRLTIVRELLDNGKTWRAQTDEARRMSIAVIEKRWPALALCEPGPGGHWKASQFLQKRLDEVIKMAHQEQRGKLARAAGA